MTKREATIAAYVAVNGHRVSTAVNQRARMDAAVWRATGMDYGDDPVPAVPAYDVAEDLYTIVGGVEP